MTMANNLLPLIGGAAVVADETHVNPTIAGTDKKYAPPQ